jgi:hypothetical protein
VWRRGDTALKVVSRMAGLRNGCRSEVRFATSIGSFFVWQVIDVRYIHIDIMQKIEESHRDITSPKESMHSRSKFATLELNRGQKKHPIVLLSY